MATQTSLVAQQVRIRQWAEQIRNCQNRPKGMDVETWCTQNNITKKQFDIMLDCFFVMSKYTNFKNLFHNISYKV